MQSFGFADRKKKKERQDSNERCHAATASLINATHGRNLEDTATLLAFTYRMRAVTMTTQQQVCFTGKCEVTDRYKLQWATLDLTTDFRQRRGRGGRTAAGTDGQTEPPPVPPPSRAF